MEGSLHEQLLYLKDNRINDDIVAKIILKFMDTMDYTVNPCGFYDQEIEGIRIISLDVTKWEKHTSKVLYFITNYKIITVCHINRLAHQLSCSRTFDYNDKALKNMLSLSKFYIIDNIDTNMRGIREYQYNDIRFADYLPNRIKSSKQFNCSS